MKHYKEEKIDLKREIILKAFFLFFPLNQILFSQIPINGFCRIEEIKVSKNTSKIFPFDFNNDGFKDLIVFNPNEKSYFSISANNLKTYNSPVFHTSSNNISTIKFQSDIYLGKKVAALINNSKEISILSFSKNGTINFINKKKLNGFCSSLDVSKNSFGQTEIITTGVGIDGIKIFHENKTKLNLYENIKGKTFSHLLYFDLNYDAFDDIVAFDINSNSLVFYYNNHFGDYDEQRSIGLNGLVNDLQSADVNSDRFTDLILNIDGKLNFFLGDSVSSFQKNTKFIFENERVKDFYVMDFNGDGINDIAFITEDQNEIKISFGKGNNNFYKPITYLRKNNLTHIVGFFDRGGRKLSAVTSDGFIYVISKIFLSDDENRISIANNAIDFTSFDYLNDGYKDLCWIDSSYNLNLALSERKNLFTQLFQIELQSNNDKLIVDDTKPEIKIYVTYKSGRKNIEIIKFNFKTGKSERKIVYTKYPIEELKITGDKFKDRFTLNAITQKNKETYFEKIEFVYFNILNSKQIKIASNTIASSLGVYGGTKISYFVKQFNNYDFIISYLGNDTKRDVKRLTFQLTENDKVYFSLVKVEQLFARASPFVSLISINNKSVIYIFTDKRNYRYNTNFKIGNSCNLYYIVNNSTLDVLFVNDKNKLVKLVFDEQFNLIFTEELNLSNEIKNYTVEKFDVRNKYLIFADGISLTFRKL